MNKIVNAKLLLFVLIIILIYIFFRSSNYKRYYRINCMKSITNTNKIAFCFLVYDQINKENIWYDYLSKIDSSLYSMYIHYKHDTQLQYFDQNKILNCIDTCYGCYNVVKAQLILMKEALKDISNTHFIILTQACLPLKSFGYIKGYLDPNKSYFTTTPDEQVFPRCNAALQFMPRHTLKKAGMGAILNRKHAELLIKNDDNMEIWFRDITNSDEHAIISLLFYLGLENELVLTNNNAVDGVVMAQWADQKGFKIFNNSSVVENKHPLTYSHVCEEELQHFINAKCLFGRKFLPECTGLEKLVELLNMKQYVSELYHDNSNKTLDIKSFDVYNDKLLKKHHLEVGEFVSTTERCPSEYGQLYTDLAFIPDPPNTIYKWKPPIFDPIPSYTKVEVQHVKDVDLKYNLEDNCSWMYITKGSGVFFDVGRTIAFDHHKDAVKYFLNKPCSFGNGMAAVNCDDEQHDLVEAAKSQNYDSIQFLKHADQRCGLMRAEIIDLNGFGQQACGSDDKYLSTGKNGQIPCKCDNSKNYLNCDKTSES